MITLGGLIGIYIATIILGKHIKRAGKGSYLTAAVLAILQVLIVLFDMYNTQMPKP